MNRINEQSIGLSDFSLNVQDYLEIGIIVCLLPEWTIQYVNIPGAQMLGRNVEKIIGLPLPQSTDDSDLFLLLNKLKVSQPQTKLLHLDNEKAWSIDWKEFHSRYAVVIIRNSPEVMLKKELDAILDCLFDGVWITDGQGITVRVNKALEQIANLKASEVEGRHVSAPIEEGKFSVSVNLKAIQERRPVTMLDEYWNGKCCLTSSTPVFNERGEIWRAVATIRDISQLEEAHKELLKTKEQVRLYQDELKRLEEENRLGMEIIGHSSAVQKIVLLVQRLAKVDSTVLILGETGVGKDLVAQSIHNLGPRSHAPFIKVNCGAIPETLIESELFGYEKGSFTGAKREGKPGMFELAQGGTIFLDEVAELPLQLQVKLLQAVEEHTICRIGGTQPAKLNLRIIAATNRNLEEMVSGGIFREDLYYRLKVLTLIIPPLRERIEDIPLLANHFITKLNEKMGLDKRLSPEAIDYMMIYRWPGNIRELRATMENLMVMSEECTITPDELPLSIRQSLGTELEISIQPLKQAVQELEKKILNLSIEKYHNSYEVAKVLKVNQSTVIRKAKRYGLSFS